VRLGEGMDAATLYTVIVLGSGPKKMTTEKFPTMAICKQAADKMRKQAPLKDATFYCVKRKADASDRAAFRAPPRQQRPPTAAPQQPAVPGMPRDFFTGTTPKS
jgi:hypothetical protein